MAWDQATNSTAVFRSWVADTLATNLDLAGAWADPRRYQLVCFSGNVTPDRNATALASSYGSGTWDLAEEVYDPAGGGGNQWPQSGIALTTGIQPMPDGYGLALAPVTRGPVTLLGPAGDLLIDIRSAPPGRGAAYHYWGGATDVLAGSLTLTWFTNQAIRFTFGPPPPVPPAPVVTGVSPLSGPSAGGTAVAVFGANMSAATAITFDGAPATSLIEVASSEVHCITPPGTPGPVDVAVTTAAGTGTGTGAFTYT
jgi:hypothetical protein